MMTENSNGTVTYMIYLVIYSLFDDDDVKSFIPTLATHPIPVDEYTLGLCSCVRVHLFTDCCLSELKCTSLAGLGSSLQSVVYSLVSQGLLLVRV